MVRERETSQGRWVHGGDHEEWHGMTLGGCGAFLLVSGAWHA